MTTPFFPYGPGAPGPDQAPPGPAPRSPLRTILAVVGVLTLLLVGGCAVVVGVAVNKLSGPVSAALEDFREALAEAERSRGEINAASTAYLSAIEAGELTLARAQMCDSAQARLGEDEFAMRTRELKLTDPVIQRVSLDGFTEGAPPAEVFYLPSAALLVSPPTHTTPPTPTGPAAPGAPGVAATPGSSEPIDPDYHPELRVLQISQNPTTSKWEVCPSDSPLGEPYSPTPPTPNPSPTP